jgi:hypothetical protein
MVWAGYVFATGRISTGLWITTPPGFTIQAAFGLIRRHDRAAGRSAQSLKVRVGQELTILLAGGVMVGAGYAGAVLNWLVAIPIIISGAPVIGAALWLGRKPGSHATRGDEVLASSTLPIEVGTDMPLSSEDVPRRALLEAMMLVSRWPGYGYTDAFG